MTRPATRPVFATVSTALASAVLFFWGGCRVDDAIVGGECAPGYERCGAACCLGGDGAVADVGADMDGYAGDRFAGDGYGGDAFPSDGYGGDGQSGDADGGILGDGVSGDGTPTEGDGALADGDGALADGEGALADGEGEGGNAVGSQEASVLCTAPLVDCGGVCVDLTRDAYNCGSCNNFCASIICQSSRCVGATTGGVVYIGHDYLTTPPASAQGKVLENAVALAQTTPVAVLSYERYAQARAIVYANAILTSPSLVLTHTTQDVDVVSITRQNYDVLLVHDQAAAPDGALATLGAQAASSLLAFVAGGGVVIVLDGGTVTSEVGGATGEMPDFITATGLLDVTSHTRLALGTPVSVTSTDAVGLGVVSPYGAGQNSVTIATEPDVGDVHYVVTLPDDAGAGIPVVVHKAP